MMSKGWGGHPRHPPWALAACSAVSPPDVIQGTLSRPVISLDGRRLQPCANAQRARSRALYFKHRQRHPAAANSRYAEVVAPERRRRALRRLTCPVCGATIETTNASKFYCTADCRRRARRDRGDVADS